MALVAVLYQDGTNTRLKEVNLRPVELGVAGEERHCSSDSSKNDESNAELWAMIARLVVHVGKMVGLGGGYLVLIVA